MADYLSSYSSSKIAHVAREKEEKRSQERRRSLMYLIAEFLREQGCIDTVESLVKEAQLSGDYQVCDNIDLDTVLVEFSDYHYAKYNKYPKICKKIEPTACNNAVNINPIKKEKINRNLRKPADVRPTELAKGKPLPKVNNVQAAADNEPNLGITVTPVFQSSGNAEHVNVSAVNEEVAHFAKERILKPIGNLYQLGTEWRDMADTISRDIVMTDLNVHWDDIEGLKECKSLLKEATVYPMKYPELFGGKLAPWQGILLYGPPGTGKTMLAKAVATECKITFFNISSTSIVSKWRGDSEKLVRILFDLAEHHAPAVIFIDEADWVVGSHADVTSSNCTDPARRFRAELLARMDGLVSSKNGILLLAATNSPWELDAALLRRLEKRILVDLPDVRSRFEFLRSYVHVDLLQDKDFFELVQKTEGYSCADLKLICKEAWMMQLRPIWQMLEENKIVRGEIGKIHHGAISKLNYLQIAFDRIKPTSKHIADMYKQWKEKFGAS